MAAAPVIIEDVWAQCENPDCEKWRRLPPGTQLDETKKWYCNLNPDPRRNTCELPEEDYDQEAEINSQYFEAGAPIAPIVLTPKPEPVEDLRMHKGSRSKSGTAGGSRAASGSGKRGKRSGSQTTAVTWSQPELLERQRWDSQVQLEHAGFQKLMQKGGSWEMAKRQSEVSSASASFQGDHKRVAYVTSGWTGHSRLDRAVEDVDVADMCQTLAGPSNVQAGRRYRYCHVAWNAWGGSTITAPLPPWLWDGMASFAPEVAKLACEGLDLSSAAAYFQAVLPCGSQAADSAASVSRLVMSAAAAVAGIGSTHVTHSAEAASSVWSHPAVTPNLPRQPVQTVVTPPVAPATLPEAQSAPTAARTVNDTFSQGTKGMSGSHVAASHPQHVSQSSSPQQVETIALRSEAAVDPNWKESQSQPAAPHTAANSFEALFPLNTAAADSAAAADIDVLN